MEAGAAISDPRSGGSGYDCISKPPSARQVFPHKPELCLTGPSKRFPVAAVDEILREVVESYLREQRYEPAQCREVAKDIAEMVKARVKDLVIPRYKIVVVTHIGQLDEQSMQIGSRCLWDPVSDTFSSYVFKNTSLFAVANVYGVYFE
ncbi:tctex1 domain-containing protein 1 isoform X1 [Neopelma chrysocephalum]|uniref:tctex1 domain-containing protein 1 isoform X1 n=1 Tax=Neopelma chrysocephalum TaxID=114329 RepID=UPI000FCD2520|nr:tctex1 domain-containing protein 1 isoform X1 [Neopelma chrysocephalum]